MARAVLWHNPGCSICREVLDLVRSMDVEVKLVPYLDEPPTRERLREVAAMLRMPPRALLRKREPDYAELGLERADDDAALEAMCERPVLIKRPIVLFGDEAVLARPAVKVLLLFRPAPPEERPPGMPHGIDLEELS